MDPNLTVRALLERAAQRLEGVSEAPHLDAELLLARATGASRARLKSHPEEVPEAAAVSRFLAAVERRASGEPVAYITGVKEFWSLPVKVSPAVLVPRPDTELLVERALA